MKSKLIVATFLAITFSAKPMQQAFTILEKTAEILTEMAPEIAAVGGAVLMNERSDNYNPMPLCEEIKYNSGHLDLVSEFVNEATNSCGNKKSNGTCNLI